MNFMEEKIGEIFKWNMKELVKAVFGCFLFAFAVNLFIVPNSLYNGGILGLSQLIRSLLEHYLQFDLVFDISGMINFLLNVPLFIIAYKFISKTFFRRTLVCVAFQTLFLTIIPTPDAALIPELLTCVLIGGMLAGFGSGMTLSASGSGGGTDIIGLVISMKNKNLSVGKIGGSINVLIYFICGILYGIPVMIYSIIYAVVASLVVDQTHEQNICSYVIIFTKKKPDLIIYFIKDELKRDTTYWEGFGGYDKSKTYILYSALSKYEMQRLERHLPELDSNAFMVKSEGVGIDGNFRKQLTK